MLLSTRWTLFLIPAKLALFIQRSRSLFIAPREADAHLLCSVRQMSIPCVLWTRCHLLCSVKHTLISYALLRGSLLWSWGDCIPLILWSHVARPFPPKKMDPISFYIHICFATLTFFYCKLLLRELFPSSGCLCSVEDVETHTCSWGPHCLHEKLLEVLIRNPYMDVLIPSSNILLRSYFSPQGANLSIFRRGFISLLKLNVSLSPS